MNDFAWVNGIGTPVENCCSCREFYELVGFSQLLALGYPSKLLGILGIASIHESVSADSESMEQLQNPQITTLAAR
jgi:hypothetical protein